jgi:hypothetical protein
MELVVHPEVPPLIPQARAHTRSACRDMRGAPVRRCSRASADETWCALDVCAARRRRRRPARLRLPRRGASHIAPQSNCA